ncbi:uncharacterized protein LOC114381519 [Glycine soja]|uniref:uncharacterized protein LOC114381519 n=1 Tax=Glycine soja TaxID=3848 RepID=UPI00103C6199|nr:uncharacterized protein LOC114381519 [Glycine soja]
MMNNIFLIQELLRKYARKRISPRCLLKIDLHKAYNSISWEFLDWMLKSMGFPTQFCSWIMECITTTSFSVVVNGSIYGHFKGQHGLRQGDPLFPYLFVLCLEYFSYDLQSLKDNINFKFHPTCDVVQLSHLAFADDIMLLSRGDLPSVSTIFAKLQHFCNVSGLSINTNKSSIYSVGVDQDITSLIQGWSSKTLSYAGKVELIRAVIQGIANFWTDIFPLPQFFLDRINVSYRNFLWGKAEVHHNYFKGGNVWDFISSASDSVLIKKIIHIRDIITIKEDNVEAAKQTLNSWNSNEQLLAGKAYDYIRGVKPAVNWNSIVWNPAIPSKMSFILWLATKNHLLTLDRAAFLNKGLLCPLCRTEAKSHAHLFFSCRISLQVWANIRDWIPLHRQTISLQCTINSRIRGRATSGTWGKFRCLALAIAVYCTWISRNLLLFENSPFSVINKINKIKFLVYKHSRVRVPIVLLAAGYVPFTL